MNRVERATWIVTVLTFGLGLLTIWIPPLLPCADLAGHMLGVHVHLNPAAFDGLLVPNMPPTAVGFLLPTVWVGSWLPVDVASRVVLTVYLLLTCTGFAGKWS